MLLLNLLNVQTVMVALTVGLLVYVIRRRFMYRLPPGPWSIPLIGNFEGRILTNVKQVHTIISPIYHSGFSDMTTYIDI